MRRTFFHILSPGERRELAASALALAKADSHGQVACIMRSCLSGQLAELGIEEEQVDELTDKIEAVARERYSQWLRGEM